MSLQHSQMFFGNACSEGQGPKYLLILLISAHIFLVSLLSGTASPAHGPATPGAQIEAGARG